MKFVPFFNEMKVLTSDKEKMQYAELLMTILEQKKLRLNKKEKAMLSDFVFEEIERLLEQIPSTQTYKEKLVLFDYENYLMGFVMYCYPSAAELAEDRLFRLKTLAKLVDNERVVERILSEMFEEDNATKEKAEELISLLKRIKDEYQKGMFYQGLTHYKDGLGKLAQDVKALFAEYTMYEMNRYLKAKSTEDTLANLEFMCDVCTSFINDELLEILPKTFALENANVSFYAAQTLLEHNKEIPDNVIHFLANNLSYACLLYEILKDHNKEALFPAELANPEYLAKSDMVRWLTYPTELNQAPDEIEYLGKVTKREEYYLFRYCSNSDNLSDDLRGKWLIGWSSEDGGTFSNFDLYEKFEQPTLEKTLEKIKRKVL